VLISDAALSPMGAEAGPPNAPPRLLENRRRVFGGGSISLASRLSDESSSIQDRLATHSLPRDYPGGQSGQDDTLDTSPEEMADGDPQKAECLWRSTLSRGPAAMAGSVVVRYDGLVLSMRASQ
jgi:hypothetical protein